MHPLGHYLVLIRAHVSFCVRLAIVVQLDIARLEALHEALLGLRLRADEATHRERRGRRRIARGGSIRARDELGLPTESDLACRLVSRGFPKVKSASAAVHIMSCFMTMGREEEESPYKLPACRSDRVRYMRVAPIDL